MAPMKRYSRHTALMVMTGKPNEAKFVVAHPSLLKTSTFVNATLARYTKGTFIFVTFRNVGEKRYLTHNMPITETPASSPDAFISKYHDELASQAVAFLRNAPEPEYKRLAVVINPEFRLTPVLAGATVTDDGGLHYEHADVVNKLFKWEGKVSAFTPAESEAETPKAAVDTRARMSAREVMSLAEIEGVFVRKGDWHLMEAMKSIADSSIATNLLFVGPSGCGKSSIPEAFAQAHDMKFFKMNCASVRDPEEWIGYREAVDGNTQFVESEFIKAVQQGNTVVVLDEFNRVEPWLHNTLYPLLDHTRKTIIHNKEVVVGKGTVFVATMNVGHRFTGTFVLDAAMANRFDAVVPLTYLPEEKETDLAIERTGISRPLAQQIVKVMSALRSTEKQLEIGMDVSVRTTLRIARLAENSELPMTKIIDYAAISLIDDPAVAKQIWDVVNPLLS